MLNRCYRYAQDRCSGWRIAFEYNAEKVEALKVAIPHIHRSWNPEVKEWWINAVYEEQILKLFPDFEAFLNQPRLFE